MMSLTTDVINSGKMPWYPSPAWQCVELSAIIVCSLALGDVIRMLCEADPMVVNKCQFSFWIEQTNIENLRWKEGM